MVTYTLSTTCTAKDSFTIALKTVKYLDALPNIVTPNNDGKNDFIDFSVYQFPAMQLYIYDRWGTKIFDSNNPNCVWQPTCDDGTYFYVITYTADCDVSGTTKTLKGFYYDCKIRIAFGASFRSESYFSEEIKGKRYFN